MWWITQTIAIFFIFLAQALNRYFGLSFYGITSYIAITILFLSWLLPLSYQLAPSFYQPYFLGVILLTIFGLFGTHFVFKETISLINYIGVFVAFVACILINHK